MLLSLNQLANRLHLSRDWLRCEALEGRIPCLKIGRKLRFNAEAVEAALAERAARGGGAMKTFRVKDIAERHGVNVNKVGAWIHSGSLVAVNVATSPHGKPRYRITPEALADFEASRSSTPQPKISRRRRRQDTEVTQYF